MIETCLGHCIIKVAGWCLEAISDYTFTVEGLVSTRQASCRHSSRAPVSWLARVKSILCLWSVCNIGCIAVKSKSTRYRCGHCDLVTIRPDWAICANCLRSNTEVPRLASDRIDRPNIRAYVARGAINASTRTAHDVYQCR